MSSSSKFKKYSEKEIDSFGFYDYKNGKGYLVPLKEIKGLSEIKLRITPPKNKQKKNIRYAKNYKFF